MKRYVMIVVSPARPTPTARAAAACPSSCVDPARESRRRACSVPRTPTTRHRTCQPPLGGGVTSSAAIDAGRGGVSETGALRWDFSPIPSGNLGDLDFIASPNLFTIPGGTTPRALVGVGSKNGVYYTVDRDTGAPVWQQAVVSGGISGGVSPSTGVAFGKVYAATFTGPPYIFALDAERRRRVAVSANGMQCVQLRARWSPIPLRLIVGYGFMQHGLAKLSRGPGAFVAILQAMGVPNPPFVAWLTILTELLGGVAVLLGAFVTIVSVRMMAVLLVAMFKVHLPYGFSSIKLLAVTATGAKFGPVGYEVILLYLACLAALVIGGAGPFAIDGLIGRRLESPISRSRGAACSNVGSRSVRSGTRPIGARDGGFAPGLDPARGDYASLADSSDPDGNSWVLQERGYRNV